MTRPAGRTRKPSLRRALRIAALRLKGVWVVALAGASGTGKSFRAALIADKRGLHVVIDDGMIVRRSTVMAGHRSKREPNLQAATRRALFDEPGQAEEARSVLRAEKAGEILVVGTAERMVRRICLTLWLPPPAEIVRVDEVSRSEETGRAVRRRRTEKTHASPVPLAFVQHVGLRGVFSKLAIGVTPSRARIMPPSREGRGRVLVSRTALAGMACHCLREYAPGAVLTRLLVAERAGMYSISTHVRTPASMDAGALHAPREALLHSLQRHSGPMIASSTSLSIRWSRTRRRIDMTRE